jgi:hypothetical protein
LYNHVRHHGACDKKNTVKRTDGGLLFGRGIDGHRGFKIIVVLGALPLRGTTKAVSNTEYCATARYGVSGKDGRDQQR